MPNHWVGREALVAALVERLTGGEGLALSAEGLPGVGKTTLAVALAHHKGLLSHFSDGVLWASLGPQPDVLGALAAWGAALGVDVTGLPAEAERSRAVHDAIGQRRLLLVIDDAWTIEAARWLRCGGPNCRHLLTTRDQALARSFAGADQAVSVPTLEEAPAFALLRSLAPEACAADPPAAQELARAVDGLPLALELLGAYLAAPEHSYFPDLAAEALAEMSVAERRLQLAGQRLGPWQSPAVSLQETIELSLTRLRQDVVAAFYALGAFAPKPERFSPEAARAVTAVEPGVLALLVARNLVERTGADLTLHQTLADVARSRMPAAAVGRHCQYYLDLVEKDRHDWRRIESVYGQIKWAWTGIGDDDLFDFVWALMLYQTRRGLWRDALAWAERALDLAERRQERRTMGTLLNNIAWLYNSLGRRQEALDYFQRALPIFEEVGDRAGLATTLNNVGMVYDSLGRRQEALDYYQRALPIREEVGDRAGLATTLNNIGMVYDSLGRRQEALDYCQRALLISEEVGDRAGESVTRYNIAMMHRAEGRLEEAIAQLRRVVEIDALVQHPDLEQDRATLAQVEAELRAQGQRHSSWQERLSKLFRRGQT